MTDMRLRNAVNLSSNIDVVLGLALSQCIFAHVVLMPEQKICADDTMVEPVWPETVKLEPVNGNEPPTVPLVSVISVEPMEK